MGRPVYRSHPRSDDLSVIFTESRVKGVFLVEPERREDSRGFFARSWCREEFGALGLEREVAQCDISFNKKRGTLRGLHFQAPPFEEVKLIRCARGAIFDVILDLRVDSPTFLRHVAVVLTAENRTMAYVPKGVAHGFQTLEDDSEVFYQMSQVYAPAFARGVRWNDPLFGIEWPIDDPVMSERDRTYEDFVPPSGAPTTRP